MTPDAGHGGAAVSDFDPASLRNKPVKAVREIADINMRTLVAAGEIVFCSEIGPDAIRSAIRDEDWYEVAVLRFGISEPVIINLVRQDLSVFRTVS